MIAKLATCACYFIRYLTRTYQKRTSDAEYKKQNTLFQLCMLWAKGDLFDGGEDLEFC